MKKSYYITTPIYYPSGHWHIGHCYTTVICDALARYHKSLGEDVFFLTGTDEHGQKVEKKAKEAGLTPKQFVDPLVDELKSVWELLDIRYDRFIRTTDPDHVECVQKIYQKLYESGDIYKAEYSGLYCTPCEAFWTESQLKNGRCPDCGREVTVQKEESYFFRLGKYADRIRALYDDCPDFLKPRARVNEMVNNFLNAGLNDLCVSRTTVKWGVQLPFDKKHYSYVWIDALANYISALGYLSDDDALMKKFWPANLHMVGKEIVRFHAIIWPALLMALGLEVPKQIYGHGWLLIGGDKLSKSKTDKISTELTDPKELVERYGSDCVRYFLLREIPFGSDGVYTNETLLKRINGDLANDLGNLVSRTSAMIGKYFGGVLPACGPDEGTDGELKEIARALPAKISAAMTALDAPAALEEIFTLVRRANKYIDETMPWALAKDENSLPRLGTVMYNLAESIRIAASALRPFLTRASAQILSSLGASDITGMEFGLLKEGTEIKILPPLFPRIDVKKELDALEAIAVARKQSEENDKNKEGAAQSGKNAHGTAPRKEGEKMNENDLNEITIDDFAKVRLMTGRVYSAERVEKADKLLKLSVKTGDRMRTIVSGIAAYYKPEELVGKTVVVVANLKPVKLRGILSEGMLLCAEDGDEVTLVTTLGEIADGATVR